MKSKRNHRKQIPNLPEEIIEEIFSRLPVKSLLKFRCVSKPLRSLIGTKKFIKTHLQNSTDNTNLTHHKIVSTGRRPYFSLQYCSLRSLLHDPITVCGDELSCPKKPPNEPFRVVGCCDGLICILVNRKQFFLWNPSTRKSKKLPKIYEKSKHVSATIFVLGYGFGYDESSDDFKVLVRIGVSCISSTEGLKAIGKIYSLKTNSWKETDFIMDCFRLTTQMKFACGKLYWIDKVDPNSTWGIVSFDLKNEVCGIVEKPHYVEEGGVFSQPRLGVIRGCLSLLCEYQKIRWDFWVLKHNGVKESWDKLVIIPYLFNPWRSPSISTPLWIGTKGEVLFFCGSDCVIYNPEDNSSRHLWIHNFGRVLEADIYVESLVSLARS